jgi:transcriptional regulator with XRE-family HTH domain
MDAGEFGAVLKALRENAGLSQAELAERLNVDQASVSRWERGQGEPGISLAVPLAAILGVDVDRLLNPSVSTGGKPAKAKGKAKSHPGRKGD